MSDPYFQSASASLIGFRNEARAINGDAVHCKLAAVAT